MDQHLRQPLFLEAGIQNYAWGDRSFIPTLFGFAPSGDPCAEAWVGAHPRMPSLARVGGGTVPLDVLLRDHAEALLGPSVARRFQTLPYLLKVLAADQPLSIQVHPSRVQARAGFAREQALGLALDADTRNYRDSNHKPELIVALTPFFALCGFRPLELIARGLAEVPELAELLPKLDRHPDSLEQLMVHYMHLPAEPRARALSSWLERLTRRVPAPAPTDPEYWVLSAYRAEEPPDPGLFFFLLLDLLVLQPGQGLFLAAGVPHAYLRGAGVEVMANSDNVLRGGLTRKHMDVEELLRVVRFDGGQSAKLDPVGTPGLSERVYETPAEEFRLHWDELPAGTSGQRRQADGPEVVLTTNANARLTVGSPGAAPLLLDGGGASLIPHAVEYTLRAESTTSFVRVCVPNA